MVWLAHYLLRRLLTTRQEASIPPKLTPPQWPIVQMLLLFCRVACQQVTRLLQVLPPQQEPLALLPIQRLRQQCLPPSLLLLSHKIVSLGYCASLSRPLQSVNLGC